ncbi:MAG: hypothetical protein KDC57_17685 [Saprospiraceae bacterium]|nr:hypothetical protein [Saprospiraceae bacterium]
MIRLVVLSVFVITAANFSVYAQDYEAVSGYVFLDSVLVLASKDGFKEEDFIQWMEEDTSLYSAFRRLRRMEYTFSTRWEGAYIRGKKPAYYYALCKQNISASCRSMDVIEEDLDGPVYRRNGQVRYYTLALLMDLFFTRDTVCSGQSFASFSHATGNRSDQLKELIFNPGSGKGIPFIGRKLEIFGKRLQPWYRYAWQETSINGMLCYVFAIQLDDAAPEDKAIVQSMKTYFRKSDHQVVYRSYHLKQSGLINFDTKIQIKVTSDINGQYYPRDISYDGYWNFPGKRGESGTFNLHFSGN